MRDYDIKTIYKPIENEISLLKERLKIKEDGNKCLFSILTYISESYGKLIRSALFFFITDLNRKSSIDLALSIELLHCASLLHDDVIDGSFLRRNKETIVSRWGKNWAVLVGDLFLAKSFEILGNYKNMEIIKLFIEGSLLMCKGQMLELENQKSLDEKDYLKIIYFKTAHLFELSCKIGAITSNNNIERLSNYGKNLGLAFQIIDDCLDIEKDIIENKKITLPIIRAIKLATKSEKEMIKRDKSQIITLVKKYKCEEYSKAFAESYIKKAKSSIQNLSLPHSASLFSLCDFVLERKE